MIKAILVINVHGKPRLTKFFQHYPEEKQQQFIRTVYEKLCMRTESMCNFIEDSNLLGTPGDRLIYRQYATLYFVFYVDAAESELEIFDLIHVFVETLDKCFGNVCELDLIFHFDKVHYILNEVILGGLIMFPDVDNVVSLYKKQDDIEKREVPVFYHATH